MEIPRDIEERGKHVERAWEQFKRAVEDVCANSINDDAWSPIVFIVWNICRGEGEVMRQVDLDLFGPAPGLVWVEASEQLGIGIPI